jgi:hypothetical protein
MVKMGTFRGIPVYVLQYSHEYQAIDSGSEQMYICEGKLFYRGVVVGSVIGNRLQEFDEDTFNELRAKGWYQDGAEMLGRITATAETRPQVEEKPEYENSEPAAADTSIVDDFMASWRDNIDSEIVKLQVTMEAEICAANKI